MCSSDLEKQFQEQVYAAVMKLPEKQAKRIYARYYLGMAVNEIAEVEGVDPVSYTHIDVYKRQVEEYCEKWLLMRSGTVRTNTLEGYARMVNRYIVGPIGRCV